MEETAESEIPRPIFRDIRRYFCDYCGICRSKKSLITSHIQTHHKEEMNKDKSDEGVEADGVKSNTCAECGANFKKAAYLRQHMRSHSLEHWIPPKELQNARGCKLGLEWTSIRLGDLLRSSIKWASNTHWFDERPYVCSVDDCQASYRRKDHLNRHLLIHKGKLFKCPIENCYREFVVQGNVKRHVKELHCESSPCAKIGEKQHVCQESGCGKVFRYLSKLRKHEDSHVKLDAVEAICLESGCMKHFSNSQCLRAHIQSCHRYTTCEICGTKQLKKNLKRHLRTHESGGSSVERIKCQFKDCCHTFSNKTNLNQHVKAVHLEVKPFACGIPGCDKRFSFKHVRDNHEKSGCHVYTPGDFEESDEQFRSRPRGGRKRKCPTVEMLIRKRVTPPADLDEYLTWFQSMASEEQS